MRQVTEELFNQVKKEKGVQQDIAKKFNISQSTVSRILRSANLAEVSKRDLPRKKVTTVTKKRKSTITTVIDANEAKITIEPKQSLLDKIIKLFRKG